MKRRRDIDEQRLERGRRERKKEAMMILWRKQTRIVYSKYTSNYGLNTRIAPDKKFQLAIDKGWFSLVTTNGTRHRLAGASNFGIVEFV